MSENHTSTQDRHLPSVSIVVPVFNGLPLLDVQIERLTSQTYAGPLEIVLSDNGSTDGVNEHVRRRWSDSPVPVRVIDSSATRGTGAARNAGVEAATGDIIAFTDQDDAARPEWIDELVAAFRDSDADVVSGTVAVDRINSPEVAGWRPMPGADDGWHVEGYFDTAIGTSLAVTRKAHQAVGGFDVDYLGGGEDNDYVWRLQHAGFQLVHTPDAVVDYRLRDTYKGLWKQMVAYGRADVRNHVKHKPLGFRGYNFPLMFPYIVVSLSLRNPLLPQRITKLSRGRWVYCVAYEYGKIRGSIENRVWCI
ncbi:glycosyltransferase [Rhodococcoides corynebacterioides]|uniref:Glycosyltransferase n=2 Tax=Rhodococcoides TaxID=3259750 RepID=A0ABS7P7V1_9NOCA|nr:glycosyltransferase [Rhodococcus corynebacterioides]MBY6368506.1 glycosyltransferase [Rhodococcus corynebacterioides]MBY6409363.1 glycosyltransferase [Rhodococcus corynebacterioides]